MGTIIPPALFGIDPDEVWEYIPKAARELPKESQPVFFLKSPDAAMVRTCSSDGSSDVSISPPFAGKDEKEPVLDP